MPRYDGALFKVTEKFDVIFDTMRNNQVRWMRDYSVVVDCVYVALSDGGIVSKGFFVGKDRRMISHGSEECQAPLGILPKPK